MSDELNTMNSSEPVATGDSPAEPAAPARPERKRRRGLVVALVAVAVMAVLALAEFVPGGPAEGVLRGLFAAEPEILLPLSPEKSVEDKGIALVDATVSLAVAVEFSAEGDAVDTEAEAAPEVVAFEARRGEAVAALVSGESQVLVPLLIEPVTLVTAEPGYADWYLPSNKAEIARQLAEARAQGVPIRVEVLEPGTEIAPRVALGTYQVSVERPVVDDYGFAWTAEVLTVEVAEATQVVVTLAPIDLATLSDEEFAEIQAVAGINTDALLASRDMAVAAKEVLDAADEDEETEDEEPVQSGSSSGRPSTGGNSGGGSSGGSTGGGGTGSGSGSGSSSGGSSGSDQEFGVKDHEHQWGSTRFVVTVPAHDETINHPAEYNYWEEPWHQCSTCRERIEGNPNDHMRATGHSGWTTETTFHKELISEAWTETVHYEDYGFYMHECTRSFCTAYETWGTGYRS